MYILKMGFLQWDLGLLKIKDFIIMKKIVLAALVLISVNVFAGGYQSDWKVYEKPQSGVTYGTVEAKPYGADKNISNPRKVSK